MQCCVSDTMVWSTSICVFIPKLHWKPFFVCAVQTFFRWEFTVLKLTSAALLNALAQIGKRLLSWTGLTFRGLWEIFSCHCNYVDAPGVLHVSYRTFSKVKVWESFFAYFLSGKWVISFSCMQCFVLTQLCWGEQCSHRCCKKTHTPSHHVQL